jgi:hypothetical protein
LARQSELIKRGAKQPRENDAAARRAHQDVKRPLWGVCRQKGHHGAV